MTSTEKRILQEYNESNSGMLGCPFKSTRYNTVRDLEDKGLVKYFTTSDGYIYHDITDKGRETANELIKKAI